MLRAIHPAAGAGRAPSRELRGVQAAARCRLACLKFHARLFGVNGEIAIRRDPGERAMEPHIEEIEPSPELPRPGSPELRRRSPESAMHVRAADLQPYVGLRYLGKLFRLLALILVVLMVAESIAGLSMHGADALLTILAEAARLLVLAGVLWGSGDLATLLIDIGHDVRATRILIGRRAVHESTEHETLRPLERDGDG
jgi:hypothetical protein